MANVKFYRMNSKETFEAELLKESFDENGLYFVMSEVPEFFLGRRRISVNDDIQHAVKAQMLGVEGDDSYSVKDFGSYLMIEKKVKDGQGNLLDTVSLKLSKAGIVAHQIQGDPLSSNKLIDGGSSEDQVVSTYYPSRPSLLVPGASYLIPEGDNPKNIKIIVNDELEGVALFDGNTANDISYEEGKTKYVKLGDYYYKVVYKNKIPSSIDLVGGFFKLDENGNHKKDAASGYVEGVSSWHEGYNELSNPHPLTIPVSVGAIISPNNWHVVSFGKSGDKYYYFGAFTYDTIWLQSQSSTKGTSIVDGVFVHNTKAGSPSADSNVATSYSVLVNDNGEKVLISNADTADQINILDIAKGLTNVMLSDNYNRTSPDGLWGDPNGVYDRDILGYFNYMSDNRVNTEAYNSVNPAGGYSITKCQGRPVTLIDDSQISFREVVVRGFKYAIHPETLYNGKAYANITDKNEGYIQFLIGKDPAGVTRILFRTVERRFQVKSDGKVDYPKRAPWSKFKEIGVPDLVSAGIVSTLDELNALHESGITQADLIKLHEITVTSEEINKLSGITVTGNELNALKDVSGNVQAQIDEMKYFSNVQAGGSTISADERGDTLVLEAGYNITLEPDDDASLDKIVVKGAKYTLSQSGDEVTLTSDHDPSNPTTIDVGTGASDTDAKIYLVGTKAQSERETSYTNDKAFIDESGCINSANSDNGTSEKVATTSDVSWNEF